MVGLATDRSKPMTNTSTCEFKQVTPQRSAPELIAQYLRSVMDHAAKQLNTEYLQVLIDHKCDFSHYDFSHVFFFSIHLEALTTAKAIITNGRSKLNPFLVSG